MLTWVLRAYLGWNEIFNWDWTRCWVGTTYGSFKEVVVASYGWSLDLQSATKTVTWETVFWAGPVDVEKQGSSSTRAELFAIAFSMSFFAEFVNYHAITTGSQLWCIYSLHQIRYISMNKSLGRPPTDADIVSYIHHLVQTIPLQIKIDWVSSHQDGKSDQNTTLSTSALLKVYYHPCTEVFLNAQWLFWELVFLQVMRIF